MTMIAESLQQPYHILQPMIVKDCKISGLSPGPLYIPLFLFHHYLSNLKSPSFDLAEDPGPFEPLEFRTRLESQGFRCCRLVSAAYSFLCFFPAPFCILVRHLHFHCRIRCVEFQSRCSSSDQHRSTQGSWTISSPNLPAFGSLLTCHCFEGQALQIHPTIVVRCAWAMVFFLHVGWRCVLAFFFPGL